MNLRIAAGLLVIGLGSFLAAQAHAADRSAAPSRVVTFSDLDLNTVAGARALEARIEKASAEVCREAVRARQDVFFGSCYAAVTDDAVAKVNRPMLTAAYKRLSITTAARR